jgi:hypothetical protein
MPDTETKPASAPKSSAGVQTLVNTTLGELLVAGAMRHPEDAGHIIADAITAAIGAVNAKPPGTEPKPGATGETDNVGVTTLMNKTLGDLLLRGTLKHPEDAGRSIAEAITAAIGAAKGAGDEPAAADAAPAIEPKAGAQPEPGPDSDGEREPGTKVVTRSDAEPAPKFETKTGVETPGRDAAA